MTTFLSGALGAELAFAALDEYCPAWMADAYYTQEIVGVLNVSLLLYEAYHVFELVDRSVGLISFVSVSGINKVGLFAMGGALGTAYLVWIVGTLVLLPLIKKHLFDTTLDTALDLQADLPDGLSLSWSAMPFQKWSESFLFAGGLLSGALALLSPGNRLTFALAGLVQFTALGLAARRKAIKLEWTDKPKQARLSRGIHRYDASYYIPLYIKDAAHFICVNGHTVEAGEFLQMIREKQPTMLDGMDGFVTATDHYTNGAYTGTSYTVDLTVPQEGRIGCEECSQPVGKLEVTGWGSYNTSGSIEQSVSATSIEWTRKTEKSGV